MTIDQIDAELSRLTAEHQAQIDALPLILTPLGRHDALYDISAAMRERTEPLRVERQRLALIRSAAINADGTQRK